MSTQLRSRFTLVAILLLCILPIALAHMVWQWAKPQGGLSFGQLIAEPVLQQHIARKWQLLPHTATACSQPDEEFAQLLSTAEHLQRAQGAEQRRIVVNRCLALRKTMPNGLYLIDPHGNAVLRYTSAQLQDAKGRQAALREIGKVLKNNQGLG